MKFLIYLGFYSDSLYTKESYQSLSFFSEIHFTSNTHDTNWKPDWKQYILSEKRFIHILKKTNKWTIRRTVYSFRPLKEIKKNLTFNILLHIKTCDQKLYYYIYVLLYYIHICSEIILSDT